MKSVDIMEAILTAIEEKIIKDWRHEGLIEGWSSGYINFDIDDKEYVLVLHENKDGQHFSMFIGSEG